MIRSVREFTDEVFRLLEPWKPSLTAHGLQPWFRGEPRDVAAPLLPALYRLPDNALRETSLLHHFRRRGAVPQFALGIDREATDLWLYVARHSGLPTRLLDWTEGGLIALYFAIADEDKPGTVWMLHPLALLYAASGKFGFDLPWVPDHASAGNIRAAWQNGSDPKETKLPMPIYPEHIHPRLQVQQACFTVHGSRRGGIAALMRKAKIGEFLHKMPIDFKRRDSITSELRILGITHATLFPDVDGLAIDLRKRFLMPAGTR